MVIGLIMLGVATPSEAAAYGCVGVIVLAGYYLLAIPFFKGVVASIRGTQNAADYWRECVSFIPFFGRAFWQSLWGAARVTVVALLIPLGSSLFSNVLAASGASVALIEWVTSFDVSAYVMLGMMLCILLLLGMFMDQLAMMLLTVPIFFPLAQQLGFDPIWFGLIMLLALEISFTTPPFGLLLFVMKGVAPPDTTMRDIYLSAIPFILCSLCVVALLILFPSLALWLPGR